VPARYADVFTVGSVDANGAVSAFSSRGPVDEDRGRLDKPDLVAPGESILSALPGGGYGELDGTSMAAPHVAGVVALMWSANPNLVGDIDRTIAILRSTATPVTGSRPPLVDDCPRATDSAGAGIVNARAAVAAAVAAG